MSHAQSIAPPLGSGAPPRLLRLPAEKPAAAVNFLQTRSRGVMDLIAHFWERLATTPPLQRHDLHLLLAVDPTSDSHISMDKSSPAAARGAMLYVPKAHRADVLALDPAAAAALAAYIMFRGAASPAEPATPPSGGAESTTAPAAAVPQIELCDLAEGGAAGTLTTLPAQAAPPPAGQRIAIDFLTGTAEGIEWLVPLLLPAVHRRVPARQLVNVVMQLPQDAPCEAAAEVRPAREADIPTLNRWRRAYREERGILFDADLDAWVSTGRVFVSDVAGQVVAVAKLDVELPDLVEIGGVYTFPDHRKRGYGSRMVADLACRIRAMKKTPTLQVDTANDPALRLYEAAGWQPKGRLARVWLTG